MYKAQRIINFLMMTWYIDKLSFTKFNFLLLIKINRSPMVRPNAIFLNKLFEIKCDREVIQA
jgi:hypothetical protein